MNIKDFVSSLRAGVYMLPCDAATTTKLELSLIAQKHWQVFGFDGARCGSKNALFSEFSRALKFPDYFGHNWDAFYECLSDFLDETPHCILVLRNSHQFLAGSEDHFRVFMNQIREVSSPSQQNSAISLVQVHPSLVAEFEARLRTTGIGGINRVQDGSF